MPVIGISVARLHELLKSDISQEKVAELLEQIGCDVEGVVNVRRFISKHSDYVIEVTPQESLPLTDPTSGFTGDRPQDVWAEAGEETVVRLDLLPVRPDIFDAGGLARALRGYMGVETGRRDYSAATPTWRVEVDARITDPRFKRPLIQCAIIRNLEIDDNLLRAIMRLQENLHWALCRDRKFASIGAYDLDTLENPIRYTLVDRHAFRFKPLFWGQRDPVSPETMLTEHPKGIDYAHLVEGMDELPALLSANENVLSLPPIINAEETKLTTNTKNVLVDVTGSNERVVEKAISILATSLVELDPRGQATLERVEMAFPDRTLTTPALAVDEFSVDPAFAQRWLGIDISHQDCVELLNKMRHEVVDHGTGRPLSVRVPAYRCDIMHEVDLVEDIAIAYGYHRIKPELVPTFTAGQGLAINTRSRQAAAALTGLGFTECLSLVLTSERNHYEKMRREISARRVTLANPISQDQTMMRENLHSSLLELLALNTDHPLPQRIFEVGDVVTYAGAPADQPRPREVRMIGGAICATRAGYAGGRSVLDALLHEMGIDSALIEYRAEPNPSALEGRSATVYRKDSESVLPIGEVFEVHPEVLENWRLNNPVLLFNLVLGDVEYHH
ncbi:phenylalanine--tRNA ligase subunit beta [bacterium]|nr:phenylalanine--tRNA ligase subunit beta [bacterium]